MENSERKVESILIEFFPTLKISKLEGVLPHDQIVVSGVLSSRPDCVAPWSACADFLVSGSRRFVGLSYPVDERYGYAQAIAKSVSCNAVRYAHGDTEYAKRVYGKSACDWFEIVISDEIPSGCIKAMSLDGFWYFDASSGGLVAIGISNINQILHENDLVG